MWFFQAPASIVGLVALASIPSAVAKPYPVHLEELREIHNASQIEKRQCGGGYCGWNNQYCCNTGEVCVTSANIAGCTAAAAATQAAGGSGWVTYTTTWVETVGLVTKTSVWSTYVGATAQATPTGSCGISQQQCASKCCDSGYYCADYSLGTCKLLGGGSSGGIATGSATATVPFQTPIPTGVNGTLVESNGGGGGLSGGAIAGIVIGVIAGIILLLLLCAYCCARAAFDGIMAILGLGRKRKHTHEETYIEEHHHSSGGAAAAGGGRRWYGQPSRPNRPKKSGGGFGNALGVGAALGGIALALGLKRRHDRRHDEKSTTISGSSAYYSDYTSSSSASSSDRRSRPTRHSSRR